MAIPRSAEGSPPRLLAEAQVMYSVYVLRSLKSLKRYVGVTSQELDEKVKEHNYGSTTWTRSNKPFQLIYSEHFENKSDALKREKFFKSGQGRKVLDNLIL